MKILLLTKYSRTGASSRLRTLQYLPSLRAAGIEVTVNSLFDESYLAQLYKSGQRSISSMVLRYLCRFRVLLTASRYDLVWVEKEVFPYLPPLAERILKLLGQPYVVDYDDAIFHHYEFSSNPIVRNTMSNKIDVVMRHSACVIAGNQYLASRADEAGSVCVQVIPTVVDPKRYDVRDLAAGCPLIIGWIGSPTTQKYVIEIKDALVDACKSCDAILRLVGATPDIAAHFSEIEVEVLPWTEETEATLIGQMDIGIMPLPDGLWEKGKCGYKLIQYMACAVPVVASPVGVNVEIVNNSGCGVLAGSTEQWSISLKSLLESPHLRSGMGKAGRIAVEETYSLQVQSATLIRVLEEAR